MWTRGWEQSPRDQDGEGRHSKFLRPLKLLRSHAEMEVERFWEMESERQKETKRHKEKERVILSCLVIPLHHLIMFFQFGAFVPAGGDWNWLLKVNKIKSVFSTLSPSPHYISPPPFFLPSFVKVPPPPFLGSLSPLHWKDCSLVPRADHINIL